MREYDSREASVRKRRRPGTKKYTIISKEKNSAYLMGLTTANGNLVYDGRKVEINEIKRREESQGERSFFLASLIILFYL